MMVALFAAAHAQNAADWQFQGTVLAPDVGSTYANVSIGNPSVVWDTVNSQFVMAFESRTTTVSANCPNGVWDVGLATSTDGVNWTMLPNPVVAPNPASGNFMSCVAAHPALVFRTTTAAQVPSMYLYFKAEGWAGADGGIGVAFLKFNGSTPYVRTLHTTPALAPGAAPRATPHVVRQGSKWRMMVQEYPDIYEYVSTTPISFTAAGTLRMDFSAYQAPVVPWVDNELFNPAYVCNDDPVGNNDLKLFVGGRDTNFGTVLSGAIGKAVSNRTTINFVLDTTPQVEWFTNDEFRHWDVVGLTTGEYVMYFDEKDGSGNNFIRIGTTDLAWLPAQSRTRYCP